MKLHSRVAAVFIILGAGIASGQVATGTPNFASFGGGPFDRVNLGNLNSHFSIPVLNKLGRGKPFTYSLTYDSSIWTPASVSGSTVWQPLPNWGWQRQNEVSLGYISNSTKTIRCLVDIGPPKVYEYNDVTYQYVYHDSFATAHRFNGTYGNCGPQSGWGFTAYASDGSGYQIVVDYQGLVQIHTRDGAVTTPPFSTSGAGTKADANGNQISVNGSSQFFDTLSSTAPVLTITGSGTPASPIKYQYTAPSGGTATYTANYTQYTVKTNFGVTGIGEYGPLSNALVTSITLPDGSSYSFTYEQTPGSCTPLSGTYSGYCVTGRLASVTLPTGGMISYTYASNGGTSNTGIFSDGSLAGLTRQLNPGGTWQYTRSLVSGSPAPGSTWTTTVIDPESNYTVINAAEDGVTSTPTYFFYETQKQIYQGSVSPSNLLATSIRCYNANYTSCPTATVSSPITRTDTYSQLPNGSTRLSEVLFNSFSLVTDEKEYNYGVALGAAPSSTYLVREKAVSYATLTNGIVNKPSSVTVYDWTSGSAVTLASSTYFYDQTTPTSTSGTPQHIAITGSRGNPTTVTTSTTSTMSLSKSFTYYDTGNPYIATDVNSAQMTYVYGTTSCGNSFPTTITGPLSFSRSIAWNCTGGVVTQITDENGNSVTSNYTDPDFWRPANVVDQLSNQMNVSYISTTAVEAALQNFNSGNSVSDSRKTLDGFGRPIVSQRLQGPGATSYDTTEIDYDNMGRPTRSTMPFSGTAGATNSSAPGKIITYDALSRPLTVADANGGAVSYTYINNDVIQSVTGTQSFQKQLEYDGLGRLTSVCEISSTLPGVGTCAQSNAKTGLWTKYTYDALGNLLSVTQNAQAAAGSHQTRSFVYDMLSRMTSESNPETGNSGANGTITYTWDTISPCGDGTNHVFLGDLVQKKDNAGNITCYSYDSAHRPLTAGNTSVTNTILRKFFYDSESSYPTGVTVSNGKTRMVEAQTFNTSNLSTFVTDEFFSYSPRGETTDVYEATPHSGSGVYYHTTASYWPTGALKSLGGIPSVPTIYYGANGTGLDGEGRYTQVTAASGTNPVSSVTYSTSSTTNPLGALTGVTFGSADSDTFTYDPNTGRKSTYIYSINGKTDTGTLTWNTNGTLQKLAIVDNIPGTSDTQTCYYQYDDVRRLSSTTCGSVWTQNFSYDSFGNITKSGSSTFAPVYSPATNQFTSIPGVTVSYDANGNLLTDNLNTYTWDRYWGSMLTVTAGSTTVTATYDALGRMVENNAGGAYTEFIYGPTGAKVAKVNGTTLIKAFIALPGGAKAIYSSTGLAYYRHADWLGSSRLTSTQSRGVYSSSAYAPFGEQYATSGTADASFTGQDQDTVSTLYDFPARRYSPSQGRWISPDPLGRGAVTLANPQSWNRYSYVKNNPLAYIDPDGTSDDDDSGDDSGGGGGDDSSGDDSSGDDSSGNGDCQYDACVTASVDDVNTEDSSLNPCTAIFGGVGNQAGDPGFAGAAAESNGQTFYPLPGNGLLNGSLSALEAGGVGSDTGAMYMASSINALYGAGNTNMTLYLFSGSSGLFQQALDAGMILPGAQAAISQVNLIEPGGMYYAGEDSAWNFSTQTFLGGGPLNTVVQSTNAPIFGGGNYPGGVTQIGVQAHSFQQAWNTTQVQGSIPVSTPCLGSVGGTSKNENLPIPGNSESESVFVAMLEDPFSTDEGAGLCQKPTPVSQADQQETSQAAHSVSNQQNGVGQSEEKPAFLACSRSRICAAYADNHVANGTDARLY